MHNQSISQLETCIQLEMRNKVLTTETQSTTDASHVSDKCVPTPKVRTPLMTMKRKLNRRDEETGDAVKCQ